MNRDRPADQCPSLLELRASIDALDDSIVFALNRRFALALRIAEHKPSAVQDVAREEEVLSHVERLTRALGGDPAAIRSIYLLILQISVDLQNARGEPASGRVPPSAEPADAGGPDEREFWSTFGEAGICVFWGLGADSLAQLDAPTRGRLVAFTHEVAAGEAERRDSLVDLVSSLPDRERASALSRLVMLRSD